MINGFTSLQKLILSCRCFLCLTFTINLNLQKYKCVNYKKLACIPCCEMASSNVTCSYMCQQRALKYTPTSIYGTKIISFIAIGLVDIWMFIMTFEIFFAPLSLPLSIFLCIILLSIFLVVLESINLSHYFVISLTFLYTIVPSFPYLIYKANHFIMQPGLHLDK